MSSNIICFPSVNERALLHRMLVSSAKPQDQSADLDRLAWRFADVMLSCKDNVQYCMDNVDAVAPSRRATFGEWYSRLCESTAQAIAERLNNEEWYFSDIELAIRSQVSQYLLFLCQRYASMREVHF